MTPDRQKDHHRSKTVVIPHRGDSLYLPPACNVAGNDFFILRFFLLIF